VSAESVSPALLEQLVTLLADQLAPKIADELEARLERAPVTNGLGTSALLDLDGLVAELPQSRKPATWKAWLYEQLRRGEVPGATKLGGRWYFDPAKVREWLGVTAP